MMAEWRPMRRKDRQVPTATAMEWLEKGEYGVLASVSPDGQPSATPLSYVLMDGAIWFHCAHKGLKTDNIEANPSVCFTVVGETKPLFEKEDYTTLFESVMVYGSARQVEEAEEKQRALAALCEKYLPQHMDALPAALKRSLGATAVWCISLDHVTGKAKRAQPE